MEYNILIVWDRMGDYHRIRTQTFQNIYKEHSLYTADLGGSDSLYKWTNSIDLQHFKLSEKPADKIDILNRFRQFRRIVTTHGIRKVILSGYGKPEYLLFTAWLKFKKIDCYYFAESWYKGPPLVESMKSAFLRNCIKGIFVSGEKAKEHFSKRLKFTPGNLTTGYSVIDNEHFGYKRTIADVRKNLRQDPVLLCVARHAPEKNLALLIEAFEKSKLSSKWSLKIIGGGPLTPELKKITSNPKVQLLSWVNYQELPGFYKKASCFVLPSSFEPWGLVVNEAMAASLPVIMSNECGCVPDLFCDNGYLFDAADEKMLIDKFNLLNQNSPEELFQMGQRSYGRIQNYTPSIWAENLKKLITHEI